LVAGVAVVTKINQEQTAGPAAVLPLTEAPEAPELLDKVITVGLLMRVAVAELVLLEVMAVAVTVVLAVLAMLHPLLEVL
jgi:hypothetical protein